MMKKIIAVNAISLRISGGLTILKQFIEHINDDAEYYIFVSESVYPSLPRNEKIHLIPIPINSAFKKIYWDCLGFKRYLKKHNIMPNVVFSLQNTSLNVPKNNPLFIYFHQGVTLHNQKWSFLNSHQRTFAFYKYIYPLFIFLFAKKNTNFIVQSMWMKRALSSRFNLSEDLIHVIKPTLQDIDLASIPTKTLAAKYTLFYPARGFEYKNHQEIIHALVAIKKLGYNLSDFAVYFTIDPQDVPGLSELIDQFNLQQNIHFLGGLSYDDVLIYYKSCTAVVYPSYIESFGLPLLEAAKFGKPLIGLDADYAKEVIGDYPGAKFAKRNDPQAWSQAILQAIDLENSLESYQPNYDSGWGTVLKLLNRDCI